MTEYVISELESMKDMSNDAKFPMMFFIEEW